MISASATLTAARLEFHPASGQSGWPGQVHAPLFLAALARSPRSDEAERFLRYVKEGGTKGAKSALGDVFWVLLNSPEFLLNH